MLYKNYEEMEEISMNLNIISVKYEDNYVPKTFSGKAYSYYTNLNLNVGDLVIAPTAYGDKIARVSEIDIPEYKIISIKPYLKNIKFKMINKVVTYVSKELGGYLYNHSKQINVNSDEAWYRVVVFNCIWIWR